MVSAHHLCLLLVVVVLQVLLEKVTGALKPGVKATTLRDAVKEIKTSVDQFEGDMGIVRKDLQKHEEDIQQVGREGKRRRQC